MGPVFDKRGQVVGWLKDGFLYDPDLHLRGFIRDKGVFSKDSKHLGYFLHGYVYHKNGRAVAFIRGATMGPPKPMTQFTPIPRIPSKSRVLPVAPIPPIPSIRILSWSDLSWEEFLEGTGG